MPSGSAKRVALVLSGGGVRGAYEVGAVKGLIEVLGLGPGDPSPFQVFTGTSVGAINATFLAAHADRGDLGIEGLVALWKSLKVGNYVQFDAHRSFLRRGQPDFSGWSLMNPAPLARLVSNGIPFDRLHKNRDKGIVHTLVIAALDIAAGRTTMFAQVANNASFRPSYDPLRNAVYTNIGLDHVLASAALPFIFPARKIAGVYYCDGGLRYNTPIAPAIRSAADGLVIIPAIQEGGRRSRIPSLTSYPNFTYMAGKLVNALLADPVERDLAVLERFNRLVSVLDAALTPDERERVAEVFLETRGHDYQKLGVLTIRPTLDIGILAGQRIRQGIGGALGWTFRQILKRTKTEEADWASYVLFDSKFAATLIELGRQNAHERANEICTFFASMK